MARITAGARALADFQRAQRAIERARTALDIDMTHADARSDQQITRRLEEARSGVNSALRSLDKLLARDEETASV